MLNVNRSHFIYYYSLFSLISSAFFLIASGLIGTEFVVFPVCLFLLNTIFYIDGYKEHLLVSEESLFQVFLIQSFIFVGCSLELQAPSFMFFTLLPAMAFALYEENRREKRKGVYLFGSSFGAYVSLSFLFKGNVSSEVISLGTFACTLFGVLYFCLISEYRTRLSKLFKMKHQRDSKNHEDRLFFHDIINQTHNLNLFLAHKQSQKLGLTNGEVGSLLGEVKTMQSIIKEHFQLGHKNLVNLYDVISYFRVKDSLENIVSNYLSSKQIDFSIQYSGDLLAPSLDPKSCLIHYPTLARIFTNLTKNIAENAKGDVSFKIGYQRDYGLEIEIKNSIQSATKENIGEVILNDDSVFDKSSGLGLESMAYLCEQKGGSFSFKIEKGYWITQVILPNPIETLKQAA